MNKLKVGVVSPAAPENLSVLTKCSLSMARRLAEATGTGVGVWIMMQANLDTWEAENMVIDALVTPFEHKRLLA